MKFDYFVFGLILLCSDSIYGQIGKSLCIISCNLLFWVRFSNLFLKRDMVIAKLSNRPCSSYCESVCYQKYCAKKYNSTCPFLTKDIRKKIRLFL